MKVNPVTQSDTDKEILIQVRWTDDRPQQSHWTWNVDKSLQVFCVKYDDAYNDSKGVEDYYMIMLQK